MIINLEVKKWGQAIRGVAHCPEGGSKQWPCVVFCHGFTGDRVEPNFMYVKIARALAEAGVVAVRFDFLGSGESDGKFKDMTISKEVEECEAVIEHVRKLDLVDTDNISLLGFSMGGAVSVLTAARNPGIIKNLILLSTAANMLDVLASEIRGEKVTRYLEDGWVDFHGNQVSKAAIEDAFRLNIYDKAKEFDGQVLLVHGTEDECVPPFTSIKLQEILQSRAQLKLINGANHHYATLAHLEELIATIREFTLQTIID